MINGFLNHVCLCSFQKDLLVEWKLQPCKSCQHVQSESAGHLMSGESKTLS